MMILRSLLILSVLLKNLLFRLVIKAVHMSITLSLGEWMMAWHALKLPKLVIHYLVLVVCAIVNCGTQPYINFSTVYIWQESVTIYKIDCALSTFDYKVLCDLMHIKGYENLIGENLNEEENCDTPSSDNIKFSAEGLANVEEKVQIKFANIFEQYKNKLEDDFEYACSSCERLHTRSNVTQYTATTEKIFL